MLTVDQIEYYVPKERLRILENLNRFNLSVAQAKVFDKIYGLQQVPVARELHVTDLIMIPVQAVIQKSGINKEQVKYLIHAHTVNVITQFGRSVIREVKRRLGLTHAVAFGTTLNNCASTLSAFEMAGALLNHMGVDDKAIIVSGEIAFTEIVQVIPNTSITGDAAAAALVSKNSGKNKLLSLEMNIHGQYAKGIWLNKQASQDFEKNYVPLLSAVIIKALHKIDLTLSDIRLIFPHNVNLTSWENVANYLGFPVEKIYLKNVSRYGHCFGADIMINYADAEKEGLLEIGDHFVMATVGLGATFAAAVFQYGALGTNYVSQ